MVAAAEGAVIKKAPWQMFTSIKSAGGRSFSNFAKARKFNKGISSQIALDAIVAYCNLKLIKLSNFL